MAVQDETAAVVALLRSYGDAPSKIQAHLIEAMFAPRIRELERENVELREALDHKLGAQIRETGWPDA
jgi:hypothetical protein